MTCRICNRSSCTESFHSLIEQEKWERLYSMNERELRDEIIDLQNEINDLCNIFERYAALMKMD